MTSRAELRYIVAEMVRARALVIRDIAGGEETFVYSSKHRGPGYLMIKGLVSQRELLRLMVRLTAAKVADEFPDIEYVSGNATGGMIPAYVLAERLSVLFGRDIPYVYVRNTRKIGGHGEYITGDKNNDFFQPGRRGLVFEELVNFAQTTTNSALVQRDAGYDVRHAATFVSYDHAPARELLSMNGITMMHLMTVADILSAAEDVLEKRLVDDFRAYLTDPISWQLAHGITPPKKEDDNG